MINKVGWLEIISFQEGPIDFFSSHVAILDLGWLRWKEKCLVHWHVKYLMKLVPFQAFSCCWRFLCYYPGFWRMNPSPISLFTQFALFALSRFISFFRRIFLRIEKRKIENNLLGFFSWLGQQQWELEPRHKDRRCCSWCSLPLILYFSILVIRL